MRDPKTLDRDMMRLVSNCSASTAPAPASAPDLHRLADVCATDRDRSLHFRAPAVSSTPRCRTVGRMRSTGASWLTSRIDSATLRPLEHGGAAAHPSTACDAPRRDREISSSYSAHEPRRPDLGGCGFDEQARKPSSSVSPPPTRGSKWARNARARPRGRIELRRLRVQQQRQRIVGRVTRAK